MAFGTPRYFVHKGKAGSSSEKWSQKWESKIDATKSVR